MRLDNLEQLAHHNRWSVSRLYLAIGGTYLLLIGLVGFFVDARFPTSSTSVPEVSGHVLGVFETNGWHNVAAVAVALPSLGVAAFRPRLSAVTALIVGASNGAVFIAFAVWPPETFWVASNGADQVVHASFAICGVLAGVVNLLDSGRRQARVRRVANGA